MFKKLIEKLYLAQKGNLATYDQFTGCLNRNWFEMFAEKQSGYVTVCDVNGLKFANDNYGHEAGDKLIKDTAETLLNAFPTAKVVRYGGDEFYVFTSFDPCEDLDKIANSTFSFGTARINGEVKSAIAKADEKMYTMKKASKNSRRFA